MFGVMAPSAAAVFGDNSPNGTDFTVWHQAQINDVTNLRVCPGNVFVYKESTNEFFHLGTIGL